LLSQQLQNEFGVNQLAFIKNNRFELNERADYFTYCFYHSLKFLKSNGKLAAITSNAWLGKDYGKQFKQFILDNFSIKYIVKSNAEHWFKDSKVSTLFTVVQEGQSNSSTKFITINSKLEEITNELTENELIRYFRDFYNDIDNCNFLGNKNWIEDSQFSNVYHKTDKSVRVSLVSKDHLSQQISSGENWNVNFIAENPLQIFTEKLINPYPNLIDSGRGTKTCFDDFHILNQEIIDRYKIEDFTLLPFLKSNREVSTIKHVEGNNFKLFVCNMSEEEINSNFPGVKRWLEVGARMNNQQGIEIFGTILNQKAPQISLFPLIQIKGCFLLFLKQTSI